MEFLKHHLAKCDLIFKYACLGQVKFGVVKLCMQQCKLIKDRWNSNQSNVRILVFRPLIYVGLKGVTMRAAVHENFSDLDLVRAANGTLRRDQACVVLALFILPDPCGSGGIIGLRQYDSLIFRLSYGC